MRKLKLILLSLFLMLVYITPIKAASFNMTASTKQVSPNATFTIKVGGDCIGRVNLSVSNGTLSTNSVWVEEGYVSVKVTANSSGEVIVTATPEAGFSDTDANIYNPGSRTIKVNIGTSNATTNPDTSSKKSNDNNLKILTIEEGKLSPEFNASLTEYTLELNEDVRSLTINATATDAKAKVEGTGKIDLKEGNNTINIVVTAENGAKKTYTINAYIEETPQAYLTYNSQKIGILNADISNTFLKEFEKVEQSIDGKTIFIYNQENLHVVYGIDDAKEKGFYLIDKEKNEIINKIIPLKFENRDVYVVASDEKLVTINDTEVPCKQIENADNYCILNTISKNNEIIKYLYESSENTIQLYPEFLISCESNEPKQNNIAYLVSTILILVIGALGYLAYKKKGKRNEKA